MYKEINPSTKLENIIESFWTFSKKAATGNFKVLPDNCTDLIFDLNQENAFVSGVMNSYQIKKLKTNSDLLGIRFKTENFGFLSSVPLEETKNLRIEVSEILSNHHLNILSQINNLETKIDKVRFLEAFVITAFAKNYGKQDLMILSVAKYIRSLKGIIKVQDLAKLYHISLRQLERRFKKSIGLTIKEFSNIVRFNIAKKAITNLNETSLLEIAFEVGFFDHSHMNYEFKRLSGENPSYFR